MFGKKTNPAPEDVLIESLRKEMIEYGPLSSEYGDLLAYLERLETVKDKKKPSRVSRDTLATVAGSLLGILLIVGYEQKHVMTSKGFGFNINPRKNHQ